MKLVKVTSNDHKRKGGKADRKKQSQENKNKQKWKWFLRKISRTNQFLNAPVRLFFYATGLRETEMELVGEGRGLLPGEEQVELGQKIITSQRSASHLAWLLCEIWRWIPNELRVEKQKVY